MEQERRRASRHFFSAEAQLFEPATGVRVSSRVADLSLHGCCLDMMNPFPPETVVALSITADKETFQANSRIVYAIPNVGAGAAFLDVESKDRALLERWVEQAAQG
jgi:hypothetical protein